MPLRLASFSCRLPKQCLNHPTGTLHTHAPLRTDSPSFYEVLEIPPDAPQSQIKKQFYSLSKAHHPDLHPTDPGSSQKFVEISDAYATLGNPEKRAAYDRKHLPASHGGGGSYPRGSSPSGSHSSAQGGPWGARPASGLSKRRGTFRGPPPSFYRSGGWGQWGEKRKAAHEGPSHTRGGNEYGPDSAGWKEEARANANANPNAAGGGFSSGQSPGAGWDDVPHFDRWEHFRRQEELDDRARERHRKAREKTERESEGEAGGDMMLKAVVVSGALVVAAAATPFLTGTNTNKRNKK